jgi:hypothetical protein
MDELSLISKSRFNVNKTLSGNSSFGSITGATQILNNTYWSSTESTNNGNAYQYSFSQDYILENGKSGSFYVRAVRKFSI